MLSSTVVKPWKEEDRGKERKGPGEAKTLDII